MRTIISSPRQNAIEPNKPRFQFYFADEPQYAAFERRGHIAHLLKCYRRHPERHMVRKLGTHLYSIHTIGSDITAVIAG